ncbi:MAG: hypothetical protein QXX68_01540 [Candidatus Pacearchaeota archaeon]
MKKEMIILIIVISLLGFVKADASGIFIGNESYTQTETSAEMEILANLESTQSWAEVEINTTEIHFGNVIPMSPWNTYRAKYKIKARGNINIEVTPILVNSNDEIFSNLYFARTYESSKSKWTKIGSYKMIFNLTENAGYWSIIGSTGLQNATWSGTNGDQSVLLDLSDYKKPIPFDIQNYRNAIRFRIVPVWQD